MKTAIHVLLITTLFQLISFNGSANYNFLAGPGVQVNTNDATTKAQVVAGSNSFSNVGLLNVHFTTAATGSVSLLDRLAINTGSINTYHTFLGCPYTKGIKVSSQLKYSALASVACVWNVAWGVKKSVWQKQAAPANKLSIALTISNPVSSNKPDSPLVHKIKTNIPLETLSVIDVVVTFAHL